MQKGFPCIFQKLTLWDFDATCQVSIEDQMGEFVQKLERIVPEEAQECLVYALLLVERGFSHGVFLHSATIKR